MGPPRCVEEEMGHFCLAEDARAMIRSEREAHGSRSDVRVCVVVVLCDSQGFPLLESNTVHGRGFPLPLSE